MAVKRHQRRAAVATALASAGLATLVSLTAGCSEWGAAADGPPGGDPVSAVRQAADALIAAGTSQTRTAMEMTSGGTRVTVRGEGVFDYAHGRGRLRIVLPQSKAPPITQLQAPGLLYMRNRGAGVPADKWLRLDTTTLSDGNLVTNGATDPLTAAELLRGVNHVSYVGEEHLGGTRVRHYRGTTDIGQAARAASSYAAGALRAAAGGFRRDQVDFDAYLDERGRLRKVRHRFTYAESRRLQVASTTEIHGFGAAADITLPPSRDVYAGTIQPAAE